MRVVFDTVILVRGLIGPFSRWGTLFFERTDEYEWVVSPDIVAEYLEVIGHPLIARKFRSVGTRNVDVMLAQLATATVVRPACVAQICRDPGDDKFLAAAAISEAKFIITEDDDLLTLGEYASAQICTADEFLHRLTHLDFQTD